MFGGSPGATTLDGAQQKKLAREQLRLALKNLKPNCWLMPLLAVVVCFMFARWVSTPVLIFWLALVAVGGSYLGVVAYNFLASSPEKLEARNWTLDAAL